MIIGKLIKISHKMVAHQMNDNNKCLGFTLIEMLVTVAIAGILLAISTPYFTEIITNNKTQSYSSELSMALFLAQNEAIKRGVQVTVKPNATGTGYKWQGGWTIFSDNNGNGTQDGTDELIQSYTDADSAYTLKSKDSVFASYVGFSATGSPLGIVSGVQAVSDGYLVLCRPDSDNNLSRILSLTFAGNIRVSKGSVLSGVSLCQ